MGANPGSSVAPMARSYNKLRVRACDLILATAKIFD